MNPEQSDITARIRAARAFANLSQPELAERVGMSLPTYKRAELGKRPCSSAELLTIARACEVPAHFMLTGFGGIGAEKRRVAAEDVAGRLDVIDERLNALTATAREMVEVVQANLFRHAATIDPEPEDDPARISD